MKLEVTVDLSDLMSYISEEELDKQIADEVKDEVLKLVKSDSRYKAYINKKASDLLGSLDI